MQDRNSEPMFVDSDTEMASYTTKDTDAMPHPSDTASISRVIHINNSSSVSEDKLWTLV